MFTRCAPSNQRGYEQLSGNQSSDTTNLRIEIKATQPFPASGTSWKSGENNDTSANTTLTSYAICAT
jgi:hypothetical protein